LLTSEFTVLTRLLARIAGGHYSTRDYSADSLRQALELYSCIFPVYRTYLTSADASPHDRMLISEAMKRPARTGSPPTRASLSSSRCGVLSDFASWARKLLHLHCEAAHPRRTVRWPSRP